MPDTAILSDPMGPGTQAWEAASEVRRAICKFHSTITNHVGQPRPDGLASYTGTKEDFAEYLDGIVGTVVNALFDDEDDEDEDEEDDDEDDDESLDEADDSKEK